MSANPFSFLYMTTHLLTEKKQCDISTYKLQSRHWSHMKPVARTNRISQTWMAPIRPQPWQWHLCWVNKLQLQWQWHTRRGFDTLTNHKLTYNAWNRNTEITLHLICHRPACISQQQQCLQFWSEDGLPIFLWDPPPSHIRDRLARMCEHNRRSMQFGMRLLIRNKLGARTVGQAF